MLSSHNDPLPLPSNSNKTRNHGDGSKKIYFAVGIYKGGSWPNLTWVAKNFPGYKICLLHVLQPSRSTAFSRYAGGLKKNPVQENLKEYHRLLKKAGLEAEEVYIKKEIVEEGIVELISEHGIKNLVMGAEASNMVYIGSDVTKYVSDKGSPLCQIWFLHKGHLIKTRHEQVVSGSSRRMTYEELLLCQKAEKEQVMVKSWNTEISLFFNRCDLRHTTDEFPSKVQTAENLQGDKIQPEKETGIEDATTAVATAITIDPALAPNEGNVSVDNELLKRLRDALEEADTAKRDAFKELSKRKKAEKDAVEAAQWAEAAEKMYTDETRIRKESEDVILRHKHKLETMSSQLVTLMEELNNALRKKSLLENEIAESKMTIEKLREKIVSSVQMLLSYKNEQDELKVSRDHALGVAEALRQQARSTKSNSCLPQFVSEFSYSEIGNATCYFHSSLKINERGTYKGLLHHTEVAIKMLNGDSLRGPSEYRLEVDVLSRLRHPNIVTMIGVCRDALAIVYEYLPNGRLEDRLNCKDNSSPLSWQTRVRIAFELCSVLIFLHSSKPQSYVHGALKPSNILLDANFTTKLSNFGNCRSITTIENSTLKSYVKGLGIDLKKMLIERTANEEPSQSHSITNVALCPYMDPEFVLTGETTTQLDIYAFGKVLLRLMTGKEALGITGKVERALDDGSLSTLLDSSAGNWPYPQSQQLAHIAVRCTDMNKENRPDLKSEILEVLRTMTKSFQSSSKAYPLVSGQDSPSKPPPYYVCPISQDVMRNPSVAADGFTYEADAIQGWLNSGHRTSPMTNLTLAHTNLVPNRTLRSAIQVWLHHH